MKRTVIRTSLAVLIAGALAAPAVGAAKPKHSPAHEAAVKKCTEAYEAAAKAAKAPNAPTGQVRKKAMHAAAEAKKDCIAKAPK
jgi:hypothetical protein